MEVTTSYPPAPGQGVAQIYFNGFQIMMSTGDVLLTLQLSGQDVARVNCSYTIAKSLHEKLGQLVAMLERQSGRPIMSTDDVSKFLKAEADAKLKLKQEGGEEQ